MVDEYVDIGDEMPTVNYQSLEIERDAQVASSSSGSGSGSSSSSGMKLQMSCAPTFSDLWMSCWLIVKNPLQILTRGALRTPIPMRMMLAPRIRWIIFL